MLPQIVIRSVGNSRKLNPPVLRKSLCIPAVDRIMRHLIGQVLSEPKLRFSYPNAQKKLLAARNVVS
jgi:hypothetical protein